jgi:uncharacterized membrane protein YwzB
MSRARKIAIIAVGLLGIAIGFWALSPANIGGVATKGYPIWLLGIGIPAGAIVIFVVIREWVRDSSR